MRRLTALLALVVLLPTGCGISAQDVPTAVSTGPLSEGTGVERVAPGELALPVYFVRDSRLEPVERRAADRSAQTALGLLVHGPTRGEVASGLRTALTPQSLTVLPLDAGASGVAVVAATRDLAGLLGSSQLLAVVQIVWTVTEHPDIDRVRITIDGVPVEVPTDAGLTRDAVSRADYSSVAPLPVPG